jgi:integrase
MAQFRLLKSGFWQAVIRKRGFPPQSKTYKLKRDCEEWATDVEAKMNRGTFSDMSEAESLTLAKGLEKYLKDVTPNKKGKYQETNRINKLIANTKISGKTFATFKSFDCAKYRDEMAALGLSASTINKELSVISHLYEVALKDWGINCVNPVKQIAKPKVQNSRDRRLSSLEEEYLLRALTDNSAGDRSNSVVIDIVMFAIETGMRKSEPFKLEWPDIDLNGCVAYLRDTKNGKPRAVPLSTKAVKILKSDDDDKIVKIKRGKVFNTTYSALTQSFRRAVKRAIRLYELDTEADMRIEGFLEDFTYHDLRHEATTRLADKLQMHELMKVTGHSDARMLARYYHPKPEDLAKKLG